MLKGKTVLLGVSGSIAAYKAAALASMLVRKECNVHVIMTANAVNFINPVTFETLTGNRCITGMFDRDFTHNVEHVALAKQADAVIVAPATADVIAKMASGIADDMLTTTILTCDCPKIIAPAMNTAMYRNAATVSNIQKLIDYGFIVIEADSGHLACGDDGAGRMPEPDILLEYVLRYAAFKQDLAGMRLLVTAGPTAEPIDPVRFITNRSTGKMGYAIARRASMRGAKVTLITGPVNIKPPLFVENVIKVNTAKEMFDAVMSKADDNNVFIKAAAVADYRPKDISSDKIKKTDEELNLTLTRTDDILAALGEMKKGRGDMFLCGFSMETRDVEENARKKMREKNLDMTVANSIAVPGAGFASDTNIVTIITGDKEVRLPLMSKDDVADRILDEILRVGKTCRTL